MSDSLLQCMMSMIYFCKFHCINKVVIVDILIVSHFHVGEFVADCMVWLFLIVEGLYTQWPTIAYFHVILTLVDNSFIGNHTTSHYFLFCLIFFIFFLHSCPNQGLSFIYIDSPDCLPSFLNCYWLDEFSREP